MVELGIAPQARIDGRRSLRIVFNKAVSLLAPNDFSVFILELKRFRRRNQALLCAGKLILVAKIERGIYGFVVFLCNLCRFLLLGGQGFVRAAFPA